MVPIGILRTKCPLNSLICTIGKDRWLTAHLICTSWIRTTLACVWNSQEHRLYVNPQHPVRQEEWGSIYSFFYPVLESLSFISGKLILNLINTVNYDKQKSYFGEYLHFPSCVFKCLSIWVAVSYNQTKLWSQGLMVAEASLSTITMKHKPSCSAFCANVIFWVH